MLHYQYATPASPDHLLALYTEHADSARALASKLLYDRCEAEDVLHDVFLTLWRRPDCFDPDRGTGRAWFMTIVRNRSMDHLRRRVPRENVDELAERLPDVRQANLGEQLEREMLWDMVGTLPPAQSDLIRRAYLLGHTHQQIADETGLPLGTVKSRIRLGLDKLRQCVQPESDRTCSNDARCASSSIRR